MGPCLVRLIPNIRNQKNTRKKEYQNCKTFYLDMNLRAGGLSPRRMKTNEEKPEKSLMNLNMGNHPEGVAPKSRLRKR